MKDSTKVILTGLAIGAVIGACVSSKKTKGAIVGGTCGAIAGAGATYAMKNSKKEIPYKKS